MAALAALAYPIVPFVPLPPLGQESGPGLAAAARLEPWQAELALLAGNAEETRWLNSDGGSSVASGIEHYRRAERLSPANPYARLFDARSVILAAARHPVQPEKLVGALEDLELGGQLAPWDAVAAPLAAKLYLDLWPALSPPGRAAALESVRRAILASPAAKGRFLERVWKVSQDPKTLAKVLPDTTKSRIMVAWKMMDAGRPLEAWKLLSQACSSGVAWNWDFVAALDEFRRRMPPEAFRRGLATLMQSCQQEPACWAAQATSLRHAGDLEGSEQSLRQATHRVAARARRLKKPLDHTTRQAGNYYFSMLWDLYNQRERFQKLADSVVEYESVFDRDGRSAFYRGLTLDRLNRREPAIALYQEAIALGEPDPCQAYLADLLFREHRYVEAIREWRSILARKPQEHAVRGRLVETYYLLGDVATARAVASGG
jgi:hypothetical protein